MKLSGDARLSRLTCRYPKKARLRVSHAGETNEGITQPTPMHLRPPRSGTTEAAKRRERRPSITDADSLPSLLPFFHPKVAPLWPGNESEASSRDLSFPDSVAQHLPRHSAARSRRRSWVGTNANGEEGRERGREGVGLGGIWAEDGERGSGRRTERERVERKQLHRQTNERANERTYSFATEFTTDAEIARGWRSTRKKRARPS